ncbi:hypothetical protein B0J13DRAFT_671679 [Dactylonectria estremocensis]|uniref:Uncharacterized protein n=1 Tax=Dactylonectria estremocensis TaxID=1079267 RepID=A0A9P9JBF9_9HYPO|nr:hypothetical protein B0J13DRAFT_671679 [Dactylonectria estremocensis]
MVAAVTVAAYFAGATVLLKLLEILGIQECVQAWARRILPYPNVEPDLESAPVRIDTEAVNQRPQLQLKGAGITEWGPSTDRLLDAMENLSAASPPIVSLPKMRFGSVPEIQDAVSQLPARIIADIKAVQDNGRKLAVAQRESIRDFEFDMAPSVVVGQRNSPIESVGA